MLHCPEYAFFYSLPAVYISTTRQNNSWMCKN